MAPSNTLLVRHLSAELSVGDKTDLLKHFGATSVKVLGTTGPMKHCAFALFEDCESATSAIGRLHQLEVFGTHLVVEYARDKNSQTGLIDDKQQPKSELENDDVQEESDSKTCDVLDNMKDNIFGKWGVEYPRNPNLYYLYPPPNNIILTNILNALASYHKFYVQVLHLMNKMNLPAPFGMPTPIPPIPLVFPVDDVLQEPDTIRTEEMSISESEMESSSDTEKKNLADQPVKVRKVHRRHKKLKRNVKIVPGLYSSGTTEPLEQGLFKPGDVFEQINPQAAQMKGIHMILPTDIQPVVKESQDISDMPDEKPVLDEENITSVSGFGTIEPIEKPLEEIDLDLNEEEILTGHISSSQLRKGKLSGRQMREMPIFKNYNSGEPSCRLYVKNLAKKTTENDLKYIYSRYVNLELEEHANIFDIRLMKEGRMKGQAFVTLPSEKRAKEAVEDTNGFVLKGKPIVCQFARSAKAKKDESVK